MKPDALSSIEALARAIHEDTHKAGIVANIVVTMNRRNQPETFDELPERWKQFRLEQARLMYQRIMR